MPAPNSDHREEPGRERGFFPLTVRSALLREVRNLWEDRGWDQPFSVTGVRWSAPPTRISADIGAAALRLEEVLEGAHPLHDLPGHSLPARFDAAILVSEGWEYPAHLTGLPLEELQRIGPPSMLPDRVEVRILTLITRAGQEDVLFLRYRDRGSPPEEIRLDFPATGRVHDVFRRYVGLPVREPLEQVKHLMGRLWLHAMHDELVNGAIDPMTASPADWDPLRSYVEGFDDELAPSLPEGMPADALEGFALMIFDGLTWPLARQAGLLGNFPVVLPDPIIEWCDDGLFARIALDQVPTQGELLDGLLGEGFAGFASETCALLRARGWLEEPTSPGPVEPPLLLEPSDPCSCQQGAAYGDCHGRPV